MLSGQFNWPSGRAAALIGALAQPGQCCKRRAAGGKSSMVFRINAAVLWRARTLGAIAVFVFLISAAVPLRADDEHPLRPIAAGSPRETLTGFIGVMDQIYELLTTLITRYAGSNRLYLDADEHALQSKVAGIVPSAVAMLDTSRIPPVLRDTVSVERALMLKVVLDRIDLPATGDIPDRAEMMRVGQKKWRLPDTEIDIVLIENGPRAGEYLVSADTVDRLPTFYERVKRLPDRSSYSNALREAVLRLNPGTPGTLYDAYQSSPAALGFVVPPRWLLGAPAWVKAPLLGLASWQWLGLGIALGVTALLVFLARRLSQRLASQDRSERVRSWSALPVPMMIIFAAGLFLPVVFALFRISGETRVVLSYVQTGAFYLTAAWVCMIVAIIATDLIVSSDHLQTRSLDSQLIRLGGRFCGFVVAVVCLVHGADELGLPAYSVLAGLGVGGLAVALAARDPIANLLGSMLIMFEKPFRVGHMVRIAGTEGTVEDVGFRSTRLRTLDNSVISLPNESVISAKVENLTVRPARRQRSLVQVTYDTTPASMEELLTAIRGLLAEHQFVNSSNFHVRFNDFGESSLNILVIFHLITTDYGLELQYREEILMRIMELVTGMGLGFAFPTRTVLIESAPAAALQPGPETLVRVAN
jgi:MscS family membrane protein